MIVCLLIICSCNDEWKDEQYNQYISFKAPVDSKGCTQINVRYKKDGKTSYKLPVIVSGSTMNEKDLNIHFAVDPDTLDISILNGSIHVRNFFMRSCHQNIIVFQKHCKSLLAIV